MARAGFPSDKQDQFMIRLPDGMRERIKTASEKNNRSMNAEIVAALEAFFPPEPTVEELLERVHEAIERANKPQTFPYRKPLIDALNELSSRMATGIEFDRNYIGPPTRDSRQIEALTNRLRRWRRAQKHGVEQSDLEKELERGLLRKFDRSAVSQALSFFLQSRPSDALNILRLSNVKFANPDAAYKAIEADLRSYYADNWSDDESEHD